MNIFKVAVLNDENLSNLYADLLKNNFTESQLENLTELEVETFIDSLISKFYRYDFYVDLVNRFSSFKQEEFTNEEVEDLLQYDENSLYNDYIIKERFSTNVYKLTLEKI